jgi:hypothetical protein
MKRLLRALSALSWGIIVCTSGSASADDSKFQIKDSILGTSLVAIQTALPELQKGGLNFEKYRIYVVMDNSQLVVLFTDPNKPMGWYGNTHLPGSVPGFEVVVSPDGKRVLKTFYTR